MTHDAHKKVKASHLTRSAYLVRQSTLRPATDDRLLLEDVTLIRGEQITLHLRFKGGPIARSNFPCPSDLGSIGRPPRKLLRKSTGCSTARPIPRLPLIERVLGPSEVLDFPRGHQWPKEAA